MLGINEPSSSGGGGGGRRRSKTDSSEKGSESNDSDGIVSSLTNDSKQSSSNKSGGTENHKNRRARKGEESSLSSDEDEVEESVSPCDDGDDNHQAATKNRKGKDGDGDVEEKKNENKVYNRKRKRKAVRGSSTLASASREARKEGEGTIQGRGRSSSTHTAWSRAATACSSKAMKMTWPPHHKTVKEHPRANHDQVRSKNEALHLDLATMEGQLAANPGFSEEEARGAAKREYHRQNAALARMRNKDMITELKRSVAALTKKSEDLQQANDVLRSQLEILTTQKADLVKSSSSSGVVGTSPAMVALHACAHAAAPRTGTTLSTENPPAAFPCAAAPPAAGARSDGSAMLLSHIVSSLLQQQGAQQQQRQLPPSQPQGVTDNFLAQVQWLLPRPHMSASPLLQPATTKDVSTVSAASASALTPSPGSQILPVLLQQAGQSPSPPSHPQPKELVALNQLPLLAQLQPLLQISPELQSLLQVQAPTPAAPALPPPASQMNALMVNPLASVTLMQGLVRNNVNSNHNETSTSATLNNTIHNPATNNDIFGQLVQMMNQQQQQQQQQQQP